LPKLENRCLDFADLGQEMVDEIALVELLADGIGPGDDLQGSVKANKYTRFSASNPPERGVNSSAKTAQL
jgi:hypothetical protein